MHVFWVVCEDCYQRSRATRCLIPTASDLLPICFSVLCVSTTEVLCIKTWQVHTEQTGCYDDFVRAQVQHV